MVASKAMLLLLSSVLWAASAKATCNSSAAKGASLLQVHVQQDVMGQTWGGMVSWVTGAFGDCDVECGMPLQRRTVQCRTMNDEPADASECEGLQKPPTHQRCDCSLMPCATKPTCEQPEPPVMPEDVETDGFECLGCFPLLADDEVSRSGGDVFNDTCMHWTATTPCRSGLPFYSMHSDALDPSLCFEFCASRGLDIFALVDGRECRCGASSLNRAIWMDGVPRPGLLLPSSPASSCVTDLACPVRVYRFEGPFLSFGMPRALLQHRAQDVSYVDSIVAGRQIGMAEEDRPEPEGMAGTHGASLLTAQSGAQPGWSRLCDDVEGCQGGFPWADRQPSSTDMWEEDVVVKYFFDADVDDVRKEAFRAAVARYRSLTCIRLVETGLRPEGFAIQVGVYDTSRCWAYLGAPSSRVTGITYYQELNLGWCRNMNHLGSIIHEIGHSLGMSHEQQRPDGPEEYFGHGPHLRMLWENIPSSWRGQYQAVDDVYTGSADDGAGDPQVGYAPYDFESIMHYPASVHGGFETIPSDKSTLVGNRQRLSEGDIKQLLDAYRCRQPVIGGTTRSTTTTTSTNMPTTTSTADQSFVAVDGGRGRACRGATSADDDETHYMTFDGVSLTNCQILCKGAPVCTGVEYNDAAADCSSVSCPEGLCKVWTRPEGIGATVAASGFNCYSYGITTATATTTATTTTTTTTATTTTTTTAATTTTTTASITSTSPTTTSTTPPTTATTTTATTTAPRTETTTTMLPSLVCQAVSGFDHGANDNACLAACALLDVSLWPCANGPCRCSRGTTTTTVASVTTATTAMGTTSTPGTTSTTSNAPSGSCVQNPDCVVNAWCKDPTYPAWCAIRSDCPAPFCIRN